MRTYMKPIAIASALSLAAMLAGGSAIAATPHHRAPVMHEHYRQACSTLAGQWSDAAASHHRRHFKSAKHEESMGARDCASHRTAMQKAGTRHYRTALRLIGVRPRA